MELLTEPQIQLLTILHRFRVSPVDPLTGEELAPIAENLIQRGRRQFEEELADWSEAFSTLEANGLLRRDGLTYQLTESGIATARQVVEAATAKQFNEALLRADSSPTHSVLCTRVNGQDLGQFDMMDAAQLEKLLEILDLGPTSRVLDVGCGLGRVSEYVSDRTGAHVIGIDVADQAIARALERTSAKRPRLDFRAGNMNCLDPDLAPVDALVAIDTLYFVEDLTAVVRRLKELLVPGGRMGIFYTQVRWHPGMPDNLLTAEGTELARALRKEDLQFKTWEFTQEEHQVWLKQREAAEALKEQFEAEGNTDIYEARVGESEMLLKHFEEGGVRRYLYLCRA